MAGSAQRKTHFEEIVERLPARLAQLQAAPSLVRGAHPQIPDAPGIYLFSEHGFPMYVGQSRRLRQRLRQHTIPSAPQNQASFAYQLAIASAPLAASDAVTRDEREQAFAPFFSAAKERVAQMPVQFIELEDPIERTIFEIYAALHLGTEKYNSFETH